MTDTVLLHRAACSMLCATAWVVFSVRAQERLGPSWGGLVAALPSVSALSLAFIAFSLGNPAAVESCRVVPLGLGACAAAAYAYAWGARLAGPAAGPAGQAGRGMAASLTAWAAALFPLRRVPALHGMLAADLAGLAMVAALLLAAPPAEGAPGPTPRCRTGPLLGRAALGGATVALAVVSARVFGPAAGGILASLPTILWTILIVTHLDKGLAAVDGLMRGTAVGLLAGLVFVNAAHRLFASQGWLAACAAAYLCCLAAAAALRRLLLPAGAMAEGDGPMERHQPPRYSPPRGKNAASS